MNTFQYIRHDRLVYGRVWEVRTEGTKETEVPTDRFVLIDKHDSISKAKHWSRGQPLGTVRRYQSLEKELGRQFMKELFK